MAFLPKKEVNRLAGFKVLRDGNGDPNPDVLAGQLVRLQTEDTITVADGSLGGSSNSVLGMAADSTKQHAGSSQNGESISVTDDYAKNGLVSVMIDGGVMQVWNDGRGAVFNADCIGVATGTSLYVDASGNWSTTQGGGGTAGEERIGMVLKAPADASDTLVLKLLV
jgi:hypothetical protein